MENPGADVDDSAEHRHFCMTMRSFGPPSHALVDYHLERDRMPLHDAVGINCNMGVTTENQDACAWYMG